MFGLLVIVVIIVVVETCGIDIVIVHIVTAAAGTAVAGVTRVAVAVAVEVKFAVGIESIIITVVLEFGMRSSVFDRPIIFYTDFFAVYRRDDRRTLYKRRSLSFGDNGRFPFK